MRKIIYFIIFLSLFSCCVNKKKKINEIFQQSSSLEHKKTIDDKTYLIGSAGKMLIVDSILIALDYSAQPILHLFDIKNNIYINGMGEKGQGPNEFLHPASLIHFSTNSFLIYDLLDNTLKKIWLDSLMAGNVFYEKIMNFNSISNSFVFPTAYDNYIAFGLYESNMFKLIDQHNNDIGYFADFPVKSKEEKKIDHRNIALAYQGTLNISPDKKKIVYVSYYGTIIGIYDIQSSVINQKFLLVCNYPMYTVQNEGSGMSSPITKEGISAFRDVYVTEKYIYSLYSGNKISELRERAFEAKDIYVFDWEGNPVTHYHLDVPVNNIAVLPNDKKIYAISNLPDPTMIEFEIDLQNDKSI